MSQVTSYTLANQSGALFRAALNQTLAAIVTQASGATAPTETHPYQLWIDTSGAAATRQLRIRNADNTAWIKLPLFVGTDNSLGTDTVSGAALALSGSLTLASLFRFWQSGTDLLVTPSPHDSTKGVAMDISTGVLRAIAGGFGFPDGSLAPTAGIIQIQTAVKTDLQTMATAGAGWAQITGLSVSITPQSAQSKFLVWAQVACSAEFTAGLAALTVRRGTTVLASPASPGSRTPCDVALFNPDLTGLGTTWSQRLQTPSMLHLDSPASASTITYDVAASTSGNGNIYINRRLPTQDADAATTPRLQSRLIVAEIGGDLTP